MSRWIREDKEKGTTSAEYGDPSCSDDIRLVAQDTESANNEVNLHGAEAAWLANTSSSQECWWVRQATTHAPSLSPDTQQHSPQDDTSLPGLPVDAFDADNFDGASGFATAAAATTAMFQIMPWLLAVCLGSVCVGALFCNIDTAPHYSGLFYNVLGQLGSRNASNLGEVARYLPFAILGCVATCGLASFISSRSKSRRINWTDSHLTLEYSGPLSMALKWSAIKRVDQCRQWELFHAQQQVFVVTTQQGKVFRLRMSDIIHKRNIGEFFSLIKTNAPGAVLNVDNNFAKENSYTELWLKYFSSPSVRQKQGLLSENMLLDDGRYRIINTISGGGQGTAYLAAIQNPAPSSKSEASSDTDDTEVSHIITPDNEALSGTEYVVLKEYVLPVHRGQLTAERTTEKLRSEANILVSLQHPKIVKVLDAFIEDYRGYRVLQHIEGESLKSLTERLGPQPEPLVVDWAKQCCEILNYMHDLTPPIVHRDITPDNLMLQPDGTIKLVDFNVAHQVDASATATVAGKHAYIPPEQFRGKPCPQSDIYALGGTMFYLLTGQEPEPITVSHPASVNQAVSRKLDEIVAAATQSSLTARTASAEKLLNELQGSNES
jgi:tRNA A-37 threonylcarbamoyl transferase component Bud32